MNFPSLPKREVYQPSFEGKGFDSYVCWWNSNNEKMIASEACGGVLESNMSTGTDIYIPATLNEYWDELCTNVCKR